jgi:uncharacterized membrane protein YccC
MIRRIDMSYSSVNRGGWTVEQPKWEWMDTIFGTVLGVFSAVATMTGWTGRRFKDVDEAHGKLRRDLDDKITVLHGRVTPLMADVAELRAHHEAKMQRLTTIERSIQAIDTKQDKQMQILYRLDGQTKGGRDDE